MGSCPFGCYTHGCALAQDFGTQSKEPKGRILPAPGILQTTTMQTTQRHLGSEGFILYTICVSHCISQRRFHLPRSHAKVNPLAAGLALPPGWPRSFKRPAKGKRRRKGPPEGSEGTFLEESRVLVEPCGIGFACHALHGKRVESTLSNDREAWSHRGCPRPQQQPCQAPKRQ